MATTAERIANETGSRQQPEASNVERALSGQPSVAQRSHTVNLTRELADRAIERSKEIFAVTKKPTLEQIKWVFEGWSNEDVMAFDAMINGQVNRG
jgi:hypothetical protein